MARAPRPKELCFHEANRDLWQGLEMPGKKKLGVRTVPIKIQYRNSCSFQPKCSPSPPGTVNITLAFYGQTLPTAATLRELPDTPRDFQVSTNTSPVP